MKNQIKELEKQNKQQKGNFVNTNQEEVREIISSIREVENEIEFLNTDPIGRNILHLEMKKIGE